MSNRTPPSRAAHMERRGELRSQEYLSAPPHLKDAEFIRSLASPRKVASDLPAPADCFLVALLDDRCDSLSQWKRVRLARQMAGKSALETAQATGISNVVLSNLESDKEKFHHRSRPRSLFEKLGHFLDVSPDWLMGGPGVLLSDNGECPAWLIPWREYLRITIELLNRKRCSPLREAAAQNIGQAREALGQTLKDFREARRFFEMCDPPKN